MSRRRALGKKVSCARRQLRDVAGSPATAAILASPASLQIKAYSAVYLGMSDTGYPCGVARDPASTGHRIS